MAKLRNRADTNKQKRWNNTNTPELRINKSKKQTNKQTNKQNKTKTKTTDHRTWTTCWCTADSGTGTSSDLSNWSAGPPSSCAWISARNSPIRSDRAQSSSTTVAPCWFPRNTYNIPTFSLIIKSSDRRGIRRIETAINALASITIKSSRMLQWSTLALKNRQTMTLVDDLRANLASNDWNQSYNSLEWWIINERSVISIFEEDLETSGRQEWLR